MQIKTVRCTIEHSNLPKWTLDDNAAASSASTSTVNATVFRLLLLPTTYTERFVLTAFNIPKRLVVVVADAAAGVAVVLAPFFVSFFVCQLLLHQQLRGRRSSCLLEYFLPLLLLLFTWLVNTSCWWARSITVTIGKWHSHHGVCRIHVHGDTFTHNTLIHPRRRCRCRCRWWCAKCSRNVRSNGEVSWYFSAPCRP